MRRNGSPGAARDLDSAAMRPRPWPRVLVATFALLLALEGLASITENAPKYRLAPLTGYELVPGYRHDGESVNLHGLRGAEIGPRRPDVPRVLCVGGSTTWGHHVRDEEAWPANWSGGWAARSRC